MIVLLIRRGDQFLSLAEELVAHSSRQLAMVAVRLTVGLELYFGAAPCDRWNERAVRGPILPLRSAGTTRNRTGCDD
jgi:hypothetical protein